MTQQVSRHACSGVHLIFCRAFVSHLASDPHAQIRYFVRTPREYDARKRQVAFVARGYVDEAQARLDADVKLPVGSWIEWGGQFRNLRAATQRLAIIVPACFVLIAAALYMAIGNVVLTATVLTAVPLALAGGVFALALRGIPFSISASVGFIAVSGVAVLNGLVLISAINKRLQGGFDAATAVIDGAMERLRPVVNTALVASLGFVPMAIATGTGAEVQHPLASVVLGGLSMSTILTLFVLPALTGMVLRRRKFMSDEPQLSETEPA